MGIFKKKSPETLRTDKFGIPDTWQNGFWEGHGDGDLRDIFYSELHLNARETLAKYEGMSRAEQVRWENINGGKPPPGAKQIRRGSS